MKRLRQCIRRLLKESIEDEYSEMIVKLNSMLKVYYDQWENVVTTDDPLPDEGIYDQAMELATSLGLEEHPDLKVWGAINRDTGDTLAMGLTKEAAGSLTFDQSRDGIKYPIKTDGEIDGYDFLYYDSVDRANYLPPWSEMRKGSTWTNIKTGETGQFNESRLRESKEEVANVMDIWDMPGGDGEEQAVELAYMMGPEFGRHPDLQIWSIFSASDGFMAITGLNYDQAMDPKYQAFVAWRSGYNVTVYPDREINPWGDTINGASAREHPPSQLDFDEAADNLREEGFKPVVTEVDEEGFGVFVKLVEV